MIDHWFWLLLTILCLVWYSTVTVYVAVKGFGDIRRMLRRLEENAKSDNDMAAQNDEPSSMHK